MCGKSIFLSIFSKYIEKQNKSVLILDFYTENYSISIIFGKIIKENIQKISKNIDYMLYKNLEIQNNYINLEKIIAEKKRQYDCIFIEINSDINLNFLKSITIICDDILFLVEPNLIEIEKAKSILEVYEYDLKISNKKIKIIFNKTNKYKIDEEILKEIFADYEILGGIEYNPEYTLYINKNTKYLIEEKSYEKIYKKLFK